VFNSTSIAAINHVLGQHAWARDLLRAHAGKRLQVSTSLPELPLLGKPPIFRWVISDQGIFQAGGADEGAPDLAIHYLGPDKQEVTGDAELAVVMGKLAQHVRWDPAEDLAKWVGKAPAQSLSNGIGTVARIAKAAGQQALKEFQSFTNKSP
jgi:ubiquinone biosynthesis accessory factor UbiJ